MHGRKRAEYKHRFQDEQVVKGMEQKAQQWYALSAKALQLRSAAASDTAGASSTTTTLELLDKMLRVNPDPLHLWNQRREILMASNSEDKDMDKDEVNDKDEDKDWLPAELALTAAALERNPKAYGAWFHRKWALQLHVFGTKRNTGTTCTSSTPPLPLLHEELALTELFLQQDERNFHCWNFRRFLVGLELHVQLSAPHSTYISSTGTELGLELDGAWPNGGSDSTGAFCIIGSQLATTATESQAQQAAPTSTTNQYYKEILQREWQFTQTKIVQNFSNFSAFHYRTKLLLFVHNTDKDKGTGVEGWTPVASSDDSTTAAIAQQEWSLMENIMFTEPDDQTIWWYHRFILDWVQSRLRNDKQNDNNDVDTSWYKEWLLKQAETLQVLIEEANDNNSENEAGGCKWALLGHHLVLAHLVDHDTDDDDDDEKKEIKSKMKTILDQLIQMDPYRAQRYKAMLVRQGQLK